MLTIFLNLNFLSIPLTRDEGEYAYIARLMLDGGVPYRDAFNQKPPGIFLIYLAIFKIFGHSIEAIHLGMLLYKLVTLVVAYLLAREFFSKGISLLSTAILAILISEPTYVGNVANTEMFLLLPLILGFYYVFRSVKFPALRQLFLAGLMASLAFNIKQVVFFPILLMGAYITYFGLKQGVGKKAISQVLVFGLAFMIPLLGIAVYFLLNGAISEYLYCVYTHNIQYSQQVPLALFWTSLKIRLPLILRADFVLLCFACVGLLYLLIRRWKTREMFFTIAFLICCFLSVSVGGYYRPHYFIILHPAISILCAVGFHALYVLFNKKLMIRDSWKNALALIFFFSSALSPVYLQRNLFFESDPDRLSKMIATPYNPFVEAKAIAKYLNKNTSPDDKIFIFGSEPEILFYANRQSATRYIIFYPLMGDFRNTLSLQKESFLEVQEAAPIYIVVVNMQTSLLMQPSTEKYIFEETNRYLRDYELVGLVLYDKNLQPYLLWGVEARKNAWRGGQQYIRIYRRPSAI